MAKPLTPHEAKQRLREIVDRQMAPSCQVSSMFFWLAVGTGTVAILYATVPSVRRVMLSGLAWAIKWAGMKK